MNDIPSSTVSTPDKVAGETPKRRRRKRTTYATTVRKIHAKACARQDAWAEGDHALTIERLTTDLEGLYTVLRDERKGQTSPYRGATTNWKAWEACMTVVPISPNDNAPAGSSERAGTTSAVVSAGDGTNATSRA